MILKYAESEGFGCLDKYYTDKNVLKILYVINIIAIICIIILVIYKLYYKITYSVVSNSISGMSALALVIVYAFLAFVMLPIWYCSLNYSVSSEEIIIQSGVLIKKVVCLRTSDVQYLTTVKCRFLPKINLNFLLMNVYGKMLAMKFLSSDDLEEIVRIICSVSEGKK